MKKFTTRTINRTLDSIPFEVALEIYRSAADVAAETAEQANMERYQEYIREQEQRWNDTHEAPYEGNFSDQIPYQSLPNLKEIRRKAGQKAVIEEWIPRYQLDTILQTHILPQIVTRIAGVDISKARTVEGQIDPLCALSLIFDKESAWDLGLYQFLMLDSRSAFVKGQYKPEGRAYCSLVPLILYPFKLHHGIKYSEWSRKGLDYVVNHSLYEAMTCKVPENLTTEQILEAREQGLIFKTGKQAGESRNPVSTYKLYDTRNTALYGLPDLAQTMLAQIWCAHPQNRTKYMVLDPRSWDSLPAPLIGEDIFAPMKVTPSFTRPVSSISRDEMPWI